ncbi:MAG: hypothetical protein WCK34_15135 [Bacteroidota bacterium]
MSSSGGYQPGIAASLSTLYLNFVQPLQPGKDDGNLTLIHRLMKRQLPEPAEH